MGVLFMLLGAAPAARMMRQVVSITKGYFSGATTLCVNVSRELQVSIMVEENARDTAAWGSTSRATSARQTIAPDHLITPPWTTSGAL